MLRIELTSQICHLHSYRLHLIIDVKNVFYVFFILVTFFYVFIFKNVGKVQSGKQINKKYFQNNSNEIAQY